MNLRLLKKSRHAPEVGDVFAMLPPDGSYLFGRVVSVTANPLGIGGALLLYVYSVRSPDMVAPAFLSPQRLLIPPVMTNRLPWSRGYFAHVENRPLVSGDVLPIHCFARHWTTPKQYFDEQGNRLDGPIEPVGVKGLASYLVIDDEISSALGIPRSAER